jgi:hypothetical protein
MPETIELRKDVPHPMRLLSPATDFGERLCVVIFLGLHETAETVRVVTVAGLA